MLLLVATVIATASGFVREMVIAYRFGTSAEADAFAVVMFAIDTLQTIAVSGIATYVLIPFIARTAQRDEGKIDSALSTVAFGSIAIVTAGTVIVAVFAGPLVDSLLSGASIAAKPSATSLLQYSAAAFPLIFAGGLIATMLQGRSVFSAPALGRVVLNTTIAAALLVLVPRMGLNAAAVAFVIAGVLQLVFIWWLLQRSSLRLTFRLELTPRVREIVALAGPALLVVLLYTIVLGAGERYFASTLGEGSIAALGYAFKLYYLLLGWGISLQTISFTRLSQRTGGEHDESGVTDSIDGVLRAGLLVLIPVGVFAGLLREPIVSAAFERGAFGEASLRATSAAFAWYLASLAPTFALGVLLRAHFALGIGRLAVISTIVWTGTSLLFDGIAVRYIGLESIPIGYGIGCLAGTVVGLIGIERHLKARLVWPVARFALVVLSAAALSSLPVLGYRMFADLGTGPRGLQTLSIGALLVVVSTALFVALAAMFRVSEARQLIALARRRRA